MTLEDFLAKLERVSSHGGYYKALCPAHKDREPSLSVMLKENGWIQATCHAGCTQEDILREMGLENLDLLTTQINYGEPDNVWPYQDEKGDVLFEAVRFPGKRFKQRHLGEDGEWVWNLQGVRRVLYRLPEVIEGVKKGRTIYVCEGEKDVEALRERGQVATCNPMGAGKWREEYNPWLEAAPVIIVADRDGPGRAHAERVKTSLQGTAAGIWVMQAKVGKDISDHFDAGLAVEDLMPLRQHVRRGIVSAKEMVESAREDLLLTEHDIPGFALSSEIPLVYRQGRTYAVGAYTGHGKTSYALPGFRRLAEQGHRVGYFSLEMPMRDLKNKLLAHKGIPLRLTEEPWKIASDPELLRAHNEALEEIESWNADIIFESQISAKAIQEITEEREYEAIFVDHIHKFAWGERRKFEEEIQALNSIALELNVMVVLLCQFKKYDQKFGVAAYPRPTLQSFRETSIIGEESSIALAIWRQTDPDGTAFTGQTMAFVLKNRHTTGSHDAAGRGWYLTFDQEREMFVPAPGGVEPTHADPE